jgi:hypothetical protein
VHTEQSSGSDLCRIPYTNCREKSLPRNPVNRAKKKGQGLHRALATFASSLDFFYMLSVVNDQEKSEASGLAARSLGPSDGLRATPSLNSCTCFCASSFCPSVR